MVVEEEERKTKEEKEKEEEEEEEEEEAEGRRELQELTHAFVGACTLLGCVSARVCVHTPPHRTRRPGSLTSVTPSCSRSSLSCA
jgi:hypothetical protein